jgi:signal transduction histidine kinase
MNNGTEGEIRYHRLLERQIRRFLQPEQRDQLTPFLESISAFYEDADKERQMLERTLDVSSKELEEANRFLRQQNQELRAQEELRASRDEAIVAMHQAQEANRAKDTFLSSMSHELRTPLNAIIGFSQILIAKPDTPPSIKGFIEKIHISGKNLLTLVNTVLDFSKIESGKMELHRSRFSVGGMVEEIQILIEPMVEKKSLRCEYRISEELYLDADRQLIKQVFLNLLSNAIKFSPEGEAITITHEHRGEEEIFSVCDHAQGIAADQIETLFDPFTQIREHQSESIKGTGLGLSIVKKIVELHGGTIRVESSVGEGSCFYVSLPTAAGPMQQ